MQQQLTNRLPELKAEFEAGQTKLVASSLTIKLPESPGTAGKRFLWLMHLNPCAASVGWVRNGLKTDLLF
jgi:hypothetical protein